jgi:hypothetical protein
MNHPSVTIPPLYGDRPEDHEMIKLGYNMFNTDNPSHPPVGFNRIPVEPSILAALINIFLF